MEYIIRRREQKDSYDIAKVVTIAWNDTYKGIVPDEELENLKNNEKERGENTFNKFNPDDNHKFVLEVDNKVVGFVNCGKCENPDFIDYGEIYALNIIKDYQGFGGGRKLVLKAIEELKEMGFNKMIISCLKGNPSNEFYKHIGGKYIKDGVYKRLNLPENIYYFDI